MPFPSPTSPPFLGSRRAAPLAAEDDEEEAALLPVESIRASNRAFFLWRVIGEKVSDPVKCKMKMKEETDS